VSREIEYTLRTSSRARRASIRVSHRGKVEVVVPCQFDEKRVPAFVDKHADWIESRVARVERELATLEPEPVDSLERPTSFQLRTVREWWDVTYAESDSSRITVHEGSPYRGSGANGDLRLTGAVSDPTDCTRALRRWLRGRSRRHLEPRLDSLAAEHGFEFSRLTVRLQRSRWGSCSSRGTISINAKCLFLPPPLTEYLLLHELCHTVHANHSADFYVLLEQHAPGARDLRERLQEGWRYVPTWADES
jgi:predicted metal-dependent hydrolase